VIRVYDELGNVIKAHEHAVEFKETMTDTQQRTTTPMKRVD